VLLTEITAMCGTRFPPLIKFSATMKIKYLFLDDVNGLDDFPDEIANIVLYFRESENGERMPISYLDLRINELENSYAEIPTEQFVPDESDVAKIREYLIKLGF
jgi:hypothetical protein